MLMKEVVIPLSLGGLGLAVLAGSIAGAVRKAPGYPLLLLLGVPLAITLLLYRFDANVLGTLIPGI